MSRTLNAAERKTFIAGYSKLLTAAWSASDFPAFIANIETDPVAVLSGYGIEISSGADVVIKTKKDGSEGLDQAIELWEQGVNGGTYTLYVIHDDDLEPDRLDLTQVSGAGGVRDNGGAGSSHTYCCSCCPCCSST